MPNEHHDKVHVFEKLFLVEDKSAMIAPHYFLHVYVHYISVHTLIFHQQAQGDVVSKLITRVLSVKQQPSGLNCPELKT